MKEALYYLPLKEKNKVQCFLCPHQCIIDDGKTGICRTRKNVEGKLFALVYDQFTSVNLDPIEKKPLYHFYPGREILSLGTVGCNFKCKGCQNYGISQAEMDETPTRTVTSDDAVRMAKEYDSIGIAYTYNEPLINFEYLLETAHEAHKYNLKNVWLLMAILMKNLWSISYPTLTQPILMLNPFGTIFIRIIVKLS